MSSPLSLTPLCLILCGVIAGAAQRSVFEDAVATWHMG